MHDFDAGRKERHKEREEVFGQKPFTFGGEVFYVRANVGYLGIKRVAALSELSSGGETFEAIEAAVFSMIDPGADALKRFKGVIENNDDPVTFDDLVELQNWLLQEQTSLPPTEPQPSVSTPGGSGPASTATSSKEQDVASTT